jgi:segregation and condensation protein B
MTREEELKQESVVEAVLFTMGKSVETRQLAAALDVSEEEARQAAERLRQRYADENRAMQIIELENSYQMCTKSDYYDQLIRVAKTPKKQTLTDVVLETLSIIAYKQPVTKAEIEKIRGVSSDHAVNRLIEYGLVYEAGRLDAPGRPALFATTEEFLRRFGIDSKKSLPEATPDQEAEIVHEVQEEVNYKFGTEPDEDGAGENAEAPEEAKTGDGVPASAEAEAPHADPAIVA